jgi:uncharacterized membrane protein YdjX (TVP38/TMEM64 family)
MRLLPFLVISLVARSPALLATLLVGDMLRAQSDMGIAVVVAAVLAFAVLALIFRKRFLDAIDKISRRK